MRLSTSTYLFNLTNYNISKVKYPKAASDPVIVNKTLVM